jgi:hypothetical protein
MQWVTGSRIRSDFPWGQIEVLIEIRVRLILGRT